MLIKAPASPDLHCEVADSAVNPCVPPETVAMYNMLDNGEQYE